MEKRWYQTLSLRLIVVLIVLLIVDVVFGKWLYDRADSKSITSMQLELFRAAVQFGVIVIVGGAIAALYRWIEKSSDIARGQMALHKEYAGKLADTYRSVKAARRLLRAGGLSRAHNCSPSQLTDEQVTLYRKQLETISEAQLTLDALGIESGYLLDDERAGTFRTTLEDMKEYLLKVVAEFETLSADPTQALNTISLDAMPELDKFTRDAENPYGWREVKADNFYEGFSRPYNGLIANLSGKEEAEPSTNQSSGSETSNGESTTH